jgi:dihydroorotase-like cyclic amidohydrolase
MEAVMSDFDLVVRGNIVDPDAVAVDGWLAVREGKIAARGVGAPPAARANVDARGQWIVPGVVDGQVHSGSQQNQEGLGWASRAAAAAPGGAGVSSLKSKKKNKKSVGGGGHPPPAAPEQGIDE